MNSKASKSFEDEFEQIGEEDLMREKELRKSKKKKHKRDRSERRDKSARREEKSARREDRSSKRDEKSAGREDSKREDKPLMRDQSSRRDEKRASNETPAKPVTRDDMQQAPSRPTSAKKDESDDFIVHFDDSKDASDCLDQSSFNQSNLNQSNFNRSNHNDSTGHKQAKQLNRQPTESADEQVIESIRSKDAVLNKSSGATPKKPNDTTLKKLTSASPNKSNFASPKKLNDTVPKNPESDDADRVEKLSLKEIQNSNLIGERVEPNSNGDEKLREELNRATEAVKRLNEPSDDDPVDLNKAKKSTKARQTPPKTNEKAAKSLNSPSHESTPKVPKESKSKVISPKESTPKVSSPKESTPKVMTPKKSAPKATTPKKSVSKVTKSPPKAATPKKSTPEKSKVATPKGSKSPKRTTRSSPNAVESPSSGRPKRELSRSASKQSASKQPASKEPAAVTLEPLSKRRKCTLANDPLKFVQPVNTPAIGLRLGLSRRRSVKSSLHPELYSAQQS